MQLRIEVRIPVAAAIIVFDDVFESGEAAVVHEGGGAGNLAEGQSYRLARLFGRKPSRAQTPME